jgi:hypothetical protein
MCAWLTRPAGGVFLALAVGCVGKISGPTDQIPVPPPFNPGPGGNLYAPCTDPTALTPTDRLTRITNIQYANSVHDALGVTVDITSFPQDPSVGGFNNNSSTLQPTDLIVRQWNSSAEAIAAQIVGDPTLLSNVAPCSAGQTLACFNSFVATVGQKLYRRPLTSTQLTALEGAWTQSSPLYPSGSQYQKSVQMALEAMLQSPSFLYRAELSTTPDSSGGYALDSYEVAEKLAFALWASGPDDTLLAAASTGALSSPAQIRAQAQRMLQDPRAHAVMRDYYSQWLTLPTYLNLGRDPTLYPSFNSAMGPDLQNEAESFLEDLTFDSAGTFADVYTSPFTYIDGPLATLYGLSGISGTTFQKVSLDPTQRAGMLTQLGFLASHSYADSDSPISRGAFVLKRLMCANFNPPGGINFMLPPVSATLKTTRQRVDQHTSSPSCQLCHGIINPIGYSFEHYDGVGQWRLQDNGVDVDSSGALPTYDAIPHISLEQPPLPTVAVADAIGMGQQLAVHPTAQLCFAANWQTYLYDRLYSAQDACQIQNLQKSLATNGYTLQQLLVDLTSARQFTSRAQATP